MFQAALQKFRLARNPPLFSATRQLPVSCLKLRFRMATLATISFSMMLHSSAWRHLGKLVSPPILEVAFRPYALVAVDTQKPMFDLVLQLGSGAQFFVKMLLARPLWKLWLPPLTAPDMPHPTGARPTCRCSAAPKRPASCFLRLRPATDWVRHRQSSTGRQDRPRQERQPRRLRPYSQAPIETLHSLPE